MKLLNKEGDSITVLDFGIVEAGKEKKYEYELFNELACEVTDIKISLSRKEVDIVEYPKRLTAGAKAKMVFSWQPPVTVKQGLKTTVVIKGTELWS